MGSQRGGDMGPASIHCPRDDRISNARWLRGTHGGWTLSAVTLETREGALGGWGQGTCRGGPTA